MISNASHFQPLSTKLIFNSFPLLSCGSYHDDKRNAKKHGMNRRIINGYFGELKILLVDEYWMEYINFDKITFTHNTANVYPKHNDFPVCFKTPIVTDLKGLVNKGKKWYLYIQCTQEMTKFFTRLERKVGAYLRRYKKGVKLVPPISDGVLKCKIPYKHDNMETLFYNNKHERITSEEYKEESGNHISVVLSIPNIWINDDTAFWICYVKEIHVQ